jgi:hypothetical protein
LESATYEYFVLVTSLPYELVHCFTRQAQVLKSL